jgi:hypothetical protein
MSCLSKERHSGNPIILKFILSYFTFKMIDFIFQKVHLIFLWSEELSVLAYKLTLAVLYFVMFLNHFFKTYLKRGWN